MWFNNQDLINEWQNHLETYQDPYFGQCYRFNSGLNMSNKSIPFKKLKTFGRDDGLWLDINSKSNPNTTETLIVYIHNHTQMPATIYNKGKYFSKGLNTHIIIKRIYDQKLESPYNDCLKDVSQYSFNKTIIDYLKNKNREYTQKECFYFWLCMFICADMVILCMDTNMYKKLHSRPLICLMKTFFLFFLNETYILYKFSL